MCARGRQERFGDSHLGFKELVAALREDPITGNVAGRNRSRNVFVFPAFEAGAIEGDQPFACDHFRNYCYAPKSSRSCFERAEAEPNAVYPPLWVVIILLPWQ